MWHGFYAIIIIHHALFLSGILRDVSGSYLVPFHMMGTMGIVGGLLMASLSVIDRLYNQTGKHAET